MQQEQVVPSIFDDGQYYYDPASVTQRFVNYLVDMIVFYLFFFLVFAIIGFSMGASGMSQEDIAEAASNRLFLYGVFIVLFIFYFTVIEGLSKGRSLGKLITGTKAVTEDSIGPISWKNALVRSLCRLIPFEMFSALNGNPWHDSMSKTLVIKKNLSQQLTPAE